MDHDLRTCQTCQKPISGHFNRKRCKPCALAKRKRPAHTLTPSQVRKATKLAGTMYQADLAEHLGVSRSNLIRWASDTGVSLDAHSYKPDTIKKVTEYYIKHGKVKTKERFPDVCTRSIVERYLKAIKPRQKPIGPEVIIKVAQMANLVSKCVQARSIDRRNFNIGGIKSVWQKKIKACPSNLNGMSKSIAIKYVKRSCPFYQPYTTENHSGQKSIVLWIDAADHMIDDLPQEIKDAIKSMAKFQKWLHGRCFRRKIMELISLEFDHGKHR